MEWMVTAGWFAVALFCVSALWAAVRDGRPLRRLAVSGAQGIGGLLLVNLTASVSGVSLGFGWLALGGSVALGLPGVIALVLLRLIFGVAA